MLVACTHTKCGHKWGQYLIPGEDVRVVECPECQMIEFEETLERRESMARENRDDERRYEQSNSLARVWGLCAG